MKLYVLESSDAWGEENTLHGVFSSEEKADEATEILDIAGTITEVELDEFVLTYHEKTNADRYRKIKL